MQYIMNHDTGDNYALGGNFLQVFTKNLLFFCMKNRPKEVFEIVLKV